MAKRKSRVHYRIFVVESKQSHRFHTYTNSKEEAKKVRQEYQVAGFHHVMIKQLKG